MDTNRKDDLSPSPSGANAVVLVTGGETGGLYGSDGPGGGFLQGPVSQWVDELVMLATQYGMDTFVFGAAETTVEQIERFAHEVAPQVRERVARLRGT